MNDIISLIDSRVEKILSQDTALKSMPCRVKEIISESKVVVESIENGAQYTVPNYSGSDVHVGENVQVFYKVNLSNTKSYIGASLNKPTSDELQIVMGNVTTGEILGDNHVFGNVYVECDKSLYAHLFVNVNLLGNSTSNVSITAYVNINAQDYIAKQTLNNSYYSNVSYSIPIYLATGRNEITLKISGNGNITDGCIYASGHGIREYTPYQPTDENDYIWEVDNDNSNTIYYIGNKVSPIVPTTLDRYPIDIIYGTTFDHSNIERALIPEGITEID